MKKYWQNFSKWRKNSFNNLCSISNYNRNSRELLQCSYMDSSIYCYFIVMVLYL